ncbi:MAG: M1 family aminopeptidase [Bacteroidota bacterium]
MYEITKFELIYRSKRWDTYLYFLLLFFYGLIAVDFLFPTHLNTAKANAPYILALTMAIVSALFTMITSMIMGVAALRDFDHHMEALLFINPIGKLDYLLGRFLGSFLILLFIFSGLLFGVMLGNYMPWRAEEQQLAFHIWHYIQPFLSIVLPNLFFGGTLFFVGGALSRRLLVVYTQGIILLTFYLFTLQLSESNSNDFIAGILDPFCYQTIKVLVKYWTIDVRNVQTIPVLGIVLYNRMFWIALGLLIWMVGYFGFSFKVVRSRRSITFGQEKVIKQPLKFSEQKGVSNDAINQRSEKSNWRTKSRQFQYHTVFYCKSILREIPFWAIIICATAIIFINSINLGTNFGVNSYPMTYLIVEELQEMTVFFFLLILVFYSGELVWKERDASIAALYDCAPISNGIHLLAKYVGLLLTYVLLLVAVTIAGVLFQISQGYYHFEWSVYFIGFFVSTFSFLAQFTALAFFCQSIVNHKFMGHLLVVSFFFIGIIALEILGVDYGLYTFGSGDLGAYSDLNGFGHSLMPYGWFTFYWSAFAVLLLIVAVLFIQRGSETTFRKRWQSSQLSFTKSVKYTGLLALLLFISLGYYIFYNTNMLNQFAFPATQDAYRAAYEKTLKQYENAPQLKIVDINLTVDLYPSERNYRAKGYFVLKNDSDQAISEIYVQKAPKDDITLQEFSFSKTVVKDSTHSVFGFDQYRLKEPLSMGDSLKMDFVQTYVTKGFTEKMDTKVVQNGTFFDNFQLPTLGYNPHIELDDAAKRRKNGLSPKLFIAKRNDRRAAKEHRAGMDSHLTNLEVILGTEPDQTAVTAGQLQRQWMADNRAYFHYKATEPIVNFFPIVSAKYEVLKEPYLPEVNSPQHPIDLEIYHHPTHHYNCDRIMAAMRESLTYYTENFGPYPYQQLRIVETPRYLDRAQSFPTIITFAESMGFTMEVNDAKDVDMPFFITAHEVAHQWWGLQVAAANVQGRKMILETLAQYSALMVLKKHFPSSKVQQLLEFERERYLEGYAVDVKEKNPLALEENQSYVYYSKGALSMYALQEYISEDSVNLALRRFISDWNSFDRNLQKERYATTEDLLGYFRAVTPDSLQYIITDLFEQNIFIDAKIAECNYVQIDTNQYKIILEVVVNKIVADSLGVENKVDLKDWMNILIYGKDSLESEQLLSAHQIKIVNEEMELEIFTNQKPLRIECVSESTAVMRNAGSCSL